MKRGKGVVLLAAFFFMIFTVLVLAAPGDLDPTFGTGGVVTYNGPANKFDEGYGVAIQRDGKIVVVGRSFNGANDDVLVLRYNSDGTLDDTFGTGGVVTYIGPANSVNHNDEANGVAIQSDGKIVVVGYSDNDVLVLRYNSNGTLDDTFGTGGVVTYDSPDPGNNLDHGNAVAIQRDGKIVVVGYTYNGPDIDVLVLRYNSDGTLDDTFGTGGVVTYNGPANDLDLGMAVAIQNDGKIVVVGRSDNGVNFDALVLRYTKKGILDTTFGTGGVVTYNGPANHSDEAYGVAIQSDGKIVVAGGSWNGANYDVLVLRYTKNGTLDSTFGTGGVIFYNGSTNGNDLANGVALQRDGKIVVVGDSFNGATNWDVLILRYTKKGILDTTFGTGGVVTYNDPIYGEDRGFAVVIQKDGKIVAVGCSFNGVNFDALVIRLLGK